MRQHVNAGDGSRQVKSEPRATEHLGGETKKAQNHQGVNTSDV